jgi:hypothetical protein
MSDERAYEGVERRRHGGVFVSEITEAQIALMVEEEVERRQAKMEERLMLHMDVKFAQLQKHISDAFPNGDPHGHRMYHEKSIRDADAWSRIKGDVLSKFLTSGLWVAIGYLIFLVWGAIKESVKS